MSPNYNYRNTAEYKNYLKVYDETFGIKVEDKDIDEILGIENLNLKPYYWKPYFKDAEKRLQTLLEEKLIDYQRKEYNAVVIPCAYNEYKNIYILVSEIKENKDGEYNNSKHLVITTYDAYSGNIIHNIKRKILFSKTQATYTKKVKYNKIKITKNTFYKPLVEHFSKMGLFPKLNLDQQQIYLTRLYLAVNFINNGLNLTKDVQGHHTFYDTRKESETKYSIIPIHPKKHTEYFHPNNTIGSNNSVTNQAKAILFSNLLKLKYFKVKQRKSNINIYINFIFVLREYFLNNKSIMEIKDNIKSINPKNTLSYNTIAKIVKHFTQYKLVLTEENINVLEKEYFSV